MNEKENKEHEKEDTAQPELNHDLSSPSQPKATPLSVSNEETPPSTDFMFTPPSQAPPKTSKILSTDDEHLNFIKEQLNFLNNESGELATPIHKSNKQKRQELARKHQELAQKRKELRSPAKHQELVLKRKDLRSPGKFKLHRGIKRSPQKLKPRKPKRVCRSIGFGEASPDKGPHSSGADADTSDDSSSEETWTIIDHSDTEIDKALEENASKQNLSVVNVKNILHQVITNEDVVAMVKNTLQDITEDSSESSLLPATYEPKMTRSKFKEVLEKDGTIHHPWPLSPLKKKEKPKTTFLELPLPEEDEEEDDEYNPEKEIEMGSYSDEDSESVTSSQISDFGSPRPSTPATPSSVSRFSDLDKTPSVQGDDELKSPMGPPTRLPMQSQKSMLGKRFHMAMAESDKKAKQQEEETIALRTRSKLSLTDTSLIELESNFVAPDITWDMYDTSCDDREWMTFLTGLHKFPENEDTKDDDENDPEYNYLAEAEAEDIDMEDFRCDRAVQVSRKEMNELMDELLEAYQDSDMVEEEEMEMLKKKAMETVKTSSKKLTKPASSIAELGLTDSQRLQLEHQMRKHVQLLTQIYVLASGNTHDYQEIKENSKFLLNELHKFSEVNSTLTSCSAYKACNLEEAVQLVNEDKEFTQIDPKNIIVNNRRTKKQAVSPSKRGRKSLVDKNPSCLSPEKGIENMLCRNYNQLSEKKKDLIYSILGEGADFTDPSSLLPKSTLPVLTTQQKEIFWKSLIFVYPEYLPHGNFLMSRDFTRNPRVCFTEAEDNLLALGFEQFRNLPYYRRLIQKFLLPCKTEDQIKIRIKNLTSKNSPDNPVKMFKMDKKLPDFTQYTDPFDVNDLQPIMKHDVSVLPVWCKEMKIREIILMNDDQLEGCTSIQRSNSVNIPIAQKRLIRTDSEKSKSAPNTPLTQPSRSVQLTALKVLQFDTDTATPSSPKVTQLQDIGRKHCASPGFIKLLGDSDENTEKISDNQSQCVSKDISDSEGITLVTSSSVGQITSGSVIKSGAIMIMHGQTPATCAAPTFVVVSKTSNTSLTGRIDSTVLSSALPSSICSVVQAEINNCNEVVSPTKLIDDISKEVHNEFIPLEETPVKTAADIIASYAPYYLSPELIRDSSSCLSQQMQERTPTKNSPSTHRYRPVAPKPIVLSNFTSPVKKVSPFLDKKKANSPRRKQLQTKALSIRPKGFIPNRHVSPVKKAASNIVNRVLRRPKTLLPKPFGMVSRPFHLHVRKSNSVVENEEDISYLHEIGTSESEGMDTDYMSGDCIDTMEEAKICNKPSVFSNRQKHNSGSNRSIESDDTQSEADDTNLYDSQNEEDVIDDEDHLADLMTASTTICFASQRQNVKDKENRRKGMKKKDTTLAMLAPDLLEVDPHKDDKDTAFAQAYLNRTKEALKEDIDKYEQFLKILYDFGKSEQSPVKLYQDLKTLLVDYPDLVSDFAGFLLPEQALECGCFMAAQEFKRAKMFLRKLEVYLARHPSHYQKVIKIFSRWSQSEKRNVKELREALEPMLKMQPHLLEELSLFFEDEHPPESYMTDYEEITLDDSDHEPDPDGYELIELPDEQDINGTKLCQCACHRNTVDQNYQKRNRHCYSCCLKVIDGELYFRVSNKVLKKVNVIYHKPIKARSRTKPDPHPVSTQVSNPLTVSTSMWEEDDPIAEKENVDISLLPSKQNGTRKKKDRARFLSGNEAVSQPEQEAPIYSCNADSSVVETCTTIETISHPKCEVKESSGVDEPPGLKVNLFSMDEDANFSPKKSVVNVEIASSSSSTFPFSIGDSSTCPDILAKALKVAMISQGDISMDVSSQNNNHSSPFSQFDIPMATVSSKTSLFSNQYESPMLSSSHSEKHFVKELFATSSDSSDVVKPVVTMTDEMSNIGVLKSLSENVAEIICTVVQNEDSTVSQLDSFKHVGTTGSLTENNQVVEKSEIFRTFGKDMPTVNEDSNQFSHESVVIAEGLNTKSCVSSAQPELNTKAKSTVSQPELEFSHSNSRLSEIKNIESPKSIISIVHPEIESSVIGFSADSNGPAINQTTEVNRLTPRRAPKVSTEEKADNSSQKVSNSYSMDGWNKDTDRIILEAVKFNGPGSETFNIVSQQLPGKTPQQVSQRFHQLLEILANDETPSEEDNEDDRNSSN